MMYPWQSTGLPPKELHFILDKRRNELLQEGNQELDVREDDFIAEWMSLVAKRNEVAHELIDQNNRSRLMAHMLQLERLLVVIRDFTCYIPNYVQRSLCALHDDLSRYISESHQVDFISSSIYMSPAGEYLLSDGSSKITQLTDKSSVENADLIGIEVPKHSTVMASVDKTIHISAPKTTAGSNTNVVSPPESESGFGPSFSTTYTCETRTDLEYRVENEEAIPETCRKDEFNSTTGPWEINAQTPEPVDLFGRSCVNNDMLSLSPDATYPGYEDECPRLLTFNPCVNSMDTLFEKSKLKPNQRSHEDDDKEVTTPSLERMLLDSEEDATPKGVVSFLAATPDMSQNIEPIRTSTPLGLKCNAHTETELEGRSNGARAKRRLSVDTKSKAGAIDNGGLYSSLWGSVTNMLWYYTGQTASSVRQTEVKPQKPKHTRSRISTRSQGQASKKFKFSTT